METNKQWKQVPFNIELAKKIQSGEVEGRIITKGGNPVRIICFDADSCSGHSIIGLVKNEHRYEECCRYFINGVRDRENDDLNSLCIELPEETPKQLNSLAGCDGQCHSCTNDCTQRKYDIWTHEFKPFDKVLVRSNKRIWNCAFYNMESSGMIYTTDGRSFEECVPFAGHEHLVGTSNNIE